MDQSLEQWRPVVGYEGLYEVSDQGKVRNCKTGKILSNKPNKNIGYVVYSLFKNKKGKMHYGHCLVLEAFVGLRPKGDYQACHGNGIRNDNRVVNLRWDTRASNYEDARKHQTNSRGSRHGQAKLTEADVILIRQDDRLRKHIAKEYKVSITTITHIKLGTTWNWL